MRKRFFSSVLVILMLLAGTAITSCSSSPAALSISDVSVTDISDTSATITWKTNNEATTHINYGGTSALTLSNTPDETLRTSHSIALSGLSGNTKYYFKLNAVDASENEVTSERLSFNTKVDATNRTAVIQTSMGTIKIELYEKRAPNTTANFIRLAQQGYYNGLIFHRVKDNFMIQGGAGNTVPTIDLEIHEELKHVDGAISMASTSAPNSASSQFFICDGVQAFLDDNYAVFGKTIEGIDVVRAIASVDTGTDEKPETDVVMTSITIIE